MQQVGAPWPAAVAVSGGSDSMALMHLLAHWAKVERRVAPVVLTVDHGLRAESARDARAVARTARAIGLTAYVLKWKGAPPSANIESAARAMRYELMGVWCRKHGISAIYVAHTLDEQAETFLLRLARGSGLDGLAGMAPVAPWPLPGFEPMNVVRPLLGTSKAELQAYLTRQGATWIEDPMNADDRFARTRIRQVFPALEEAGISRSRVASAAAHLARARQAMEHMTSEFIASATKSAKDDIILNLGDLRQAPREVGLRALAAILMRVSAAAYRPRFERLESLFDALMAGTVQKPRTLHGCLLIPEPKAVSGAPQTLTIRREPLRRN
ncbi:MAG TPA: tRNA lysidine(34) synthetase TilS [Rhizomicrobium sp.]|jgi:tRNA(Ile)-lysidine synthase|nr:tRNA lysidine(34) synthetase TilS [Rhizomicrobium sp.]